jgi:hypothetical protein
MTDTTNTSAGDDTALPTDDLTPRNSAAHARAMRLLWEQPEYRKKMAKARRKGHRTKRRMAALKRLEAERPFREFCSSKKLALKAGVELWKRRQLAFRQCKPRKTCEE